ncbi:hypothetical protein [Psychromonas ossibalaenae]|nr:hypothetical protein [Psychromonas ossibalaenae]
MLLVAGGIVVHSNSTVHHQVKSIISSLPTLSYISAGYVMFANA